MAVVQDLREIRGPVGPEEIAAFEVDVLAGLVLARSAAGLTDATIRSDVGQVHLRGDVHLRLRRAEAALATTTDYGEHQRTEPR